MAKLTRTQAIRAGQARQDAVDRAAAKKNRDFLASVGLARSSKARNPKQFIESAKKTTRKRRSNTSGPSSSGTASSAQRAPQRVNSIVSKGARTKVTLAPSTGTAEKFNILAEYMAAIGTIHDGPLDIAGRKAVSIIRKRTLTGVSVFGSRFRRLKKRGDPPSRLGKRKRYSEWKAGAIKSLPKPPSQTVSPPMSNLYLTGNLYRSIRFWKGSKGGKPALTIGVGRNVVKASAIAFGNARTPARPFIGLNAKEMTIVTDLFMSRMTRRFRAVLGAK